MIITISDVKNLYHSILKIHGFKKIHSYHLI